LVFRAECSNHFFRIEKFVSFYAAAAAQAKAKAKAINKNENMNSKNNNINKTPVIFYLHADKHKSIICKENVGKSGIYC
jgi:predicted transcriptional regulator